MRRAVAVAFVVLGVLVATTRPGAAAAAVESGWWSSAPAAAYPDASGGGLVVQGGVAADRPAAYAAVSAAVPPDATAVSLKLAVAPDSASTPNTVLAACPLTASFTPAQGGSITDAPSYDCSGRATATPSADGSDYTFDVAALVRDGELAVAIVPTAATDRVVLSRPSSDAVESTAPVSSTSETSSETSAEPDAGLTGQEDAASSSGAATASEPARSATETFLAETAFPSDPVFPAADLPAVEAPSALAAPADAEAPPAPAVDNARAVSSEPTTFAAAPDLTGGGDGSFVPPLIFAGLALTAAVLWSLAGSSPVSPLEVDAG